MEASCPSGMNQQHIMSTPAKEIADQLMPFLVRAGLDPIEGPDPLHVAEAYHERAETLLHMAASARYCYEDFEAFDETSAKKHLRPVILEPLRTVRARLHSLEHWGMTQIDQVIRDVAAEYEINLGKLGQPLRVAVTGGPVSPPIDTTLWLVGRERVLARVDRAIEFVEDRASGVK
jgi:glutamyl-tRNA synthetase